MATSMNSDKAHLGNNRPWYEGPDGSCNLLTPTLINMGEDKPLHLMYPVHWTDSLDVLPLAKNMASEQDALLVLMLYGEASDSEIASLILELADARVLPLWIGEQNRKKFNRIVAMLSGKAESNGSE